MDTNLNKVIAAIMWGGALLSSAASADALVRTTATSTDYAFVSSNYFASSANHCGYSWSYQQNMKFLDKSCSTGICPVPDRDPFVQSLYAAGRKDAYLYQSCQSANIYGLNSCAC